MQTVSVVITDLDNTLFDWVEIWHEPFKAMLDQLVSASGIDRDTLIKEFQQIHRKYQTVEYAFAIEELPSLQELHPGQNLAEVYDEAIHAFRSRRNEVLALYPSVEESLQCLKDHKCLIIGYTESQAFYTHFRMKRLGLDRILDCVYSPADHELPGGQSLANVRMYEPEHYKLRRTEVRHTPAGEKKPNPDILLQIIRDVGALPDETIYIGDDLAKDVSMAQHARVTEVWASYGTAHEREEYDLLRRVTHWSEAEVQRQRETKAAAVEPAHELREGFDELLTLLRFVPFVDKSPHRISVVVDAWKTTVDVQKHFNDLEMKVRNFALTLVTAIIAGAAFSIKENVRFIAGTVDLPLGAVILASGIPIWLAFYFMDRFWYHKLLLGAVMHGIAIERRLRPILPELSLAGSIGEASAVKLTRGVTIRSNWKINLFYWLGALLMGAAALGVSFVDVRSATEPARVSAPQSTSK
jgi:FMN phosphatase YigB (HAD superfamily)